MDRNTSLSPNRSAAQLLNMTSLSVRQPLPLYFIPLYLAFMILSLLPRPSAIRSWTATSLTVSFVIYLFNFTLGSFARDFAVYCFFTNLVFQHLSLMHWVVPERDYLPPYPVDFNNTWAKLRWATTVVFSTRGMGWSHELKCVRPLQLRAARLSRIRYTFSSILSLVFFVALVDVQTAWRESVLRDWTAEAPTGITHLPWRLQLPLLWSHAAVSFAGIAGAYTAAAIPMVGLGFFDPVDFPGLFGDLRDAYTVRRPWNRVWHQNLRHVSAILFAMISSFCIILS